MNENWTTASPSSTSDVPSRPAPNAAPLTNTSPVWKRRRISEPHQGRRASKTTRACDACKAKKARCSGVKPCATCAEKSIECSYDSQYLRGRPPTPPSSTPEAASLADQSKEAGPSRTNAPTTETKDYPLSHPRSSPELDSSDVHGQYVDLTSGLSFLQRAQSRLKHPSPGGGATRVNQPLNTAGDKPLLGSPLEGPNTNYQASLHARVDLPMGPDAQELLNLYFDVCISTYKPLHRPTVESWYGLASNNIARGFPMSQGLGHAQASILLSIFAIATFHRQKSRGYADDISSLSESDAFFRRSLGFTETETGVAHLESAQARILQTFYLLMTCRNNQSWYVFGSLLQIISALGMHRRHRRGSAVSQPDYIHLESRKRTFWSAYILDRYLGVVMGRPRHFHDDYIDQELPDCVNDAEMSPAGRIPNYNPEDCHMDGFVCNIKLARILGNISHDLYPITPLSETRRVELTRKFGKELDGWQASLPPFLSTVRPSSLVRSFRRQCIALRLAYDHAVMHLYRPFLLSRRGRQSRSTDATETFQQEGVQLCISAAQDSLRTIDAFAQDGPLFHAFWWTHYICFCALTVVYVWNTQQPSSDIEGVDRSRLVVLAEQCQVHLAQATATNSPSRRYGIILEELRSESRRGAFPDLPEPQSTPMSTASDLPVFDKNAHALAETVTAVPYASPFLVQNQVQREVPAERSEAAAAAAMSSEIPVGMRNPFMNWQTSDWLEIDASAYGIIPGYSLGPNVQWFGGT